MTIASNKPINKSTKNKLTKSNDEYKLIFSVLFRACPFFLPSTTTFYHHPPFLDRSGIGSSEDKLETIKIPTASLLLWPGNFLATSLSSLAMTLSCRCIKSIFQRSTFSHIGSLSKVLDLGIRGQ